MQEIVSLIRQSDVVTQVRHGTAGAGWCGGTGKAWRSEEGVGGILQLVGVARRFPSRFQLEEEKMPYSALSLATGVMGRSTVLVGIVNHAEQSAG